MKDLKYWIWLSRIEGLTPKLLYDLIIKYENPKIIWNKTREELVSEGTKEIYATRITDCFYKKNLDKYVEYMRKKQYRSD